MGGTSGGTSVVYPSTPAAPTAGQSAAEYAAALPQIYQTSLQYQPQFDQAQLQSFLQTAPQYTQSLYDISKGLYPATTGLQESLANTAQQNMNATQLPDYVRQQYTSDLNAQLGNNAGSPVGADYVSRNLLNQLEGYRQYYQNLGLSVTGRQPLAQPMAQQSNFNVADQFAGNYQTATQGYGSYANASRPVATNNGTPNWISGLQAGGSVLQGLGSLGAMF